MKFTLVMELDDKEKVAALTKRLRIQGWSVIASPPEKIMSIVASDVPSLEKLLSDVQDDECFPMTAAALIKELKAFDPDSYPLVQPGPGPEPMRFTNASVPSAVAYNEGFAQLLSDGR